MIEFIQSDGGRDSAGFRGYTGDCGVRAAAITSGVPYREVYDAINVLAQRERPRKGRRRSQARDGVWPRTLGRWLESQGFTWTPTMTVGSGCRVHVRADELPDGRLVLRVSKHFTAVIDGVLYDQHDCSRGGERCVYGYWRRAS